MFLGVPKSIVVRLGWMTVSYGTVQLLRLLNNVILARILAPPIFGLMAVVNAIRTGVELLSDVGIMQNIISSPRGEDPLFYDTAWTLQALRGLVLAALCMLLAVPIARFFQLPAAGGHSAGRVAVLCLHRLRFYGATAASRSNCRSRA